MNNRQSIRMTSISAHLVGSLTLVAIGVVFVFLVWRPIERRKERDLERLVDLQRLFETANRARANSNRLQNELQQLEKGLVALREQIPDKPREAEFLGVLARMADEEGLTIGDYRRGNVSNKGGYSQLEIGLSGQGSFASICRFIARLESLPRLTSLREFEVRHAAVGPTYPVEMTIVLFFGAVNRGAGHG